MTGLKSFCKKFNTTVVAVNKGYCFNNPCGCKGFVRKKQIERDEEIAEELQDRNKSDRGAESKGS